MHRTLDRLAEQAPETPVVVLGFSQGACLAAEFVFRAPGRVTGLICLTGGLIGNQIEAAGPAAGSAGTPILLTGGDPNPHVPWARIEQTAEAYRRTGADVRLHRFPGKPHGVSMEELRLAAGTTARAVERAG